MARSDNLRKTGMTFCALLMSSLTISCSDKLFSIKFQIPAYLYLYLKIMKGITM